MHYEFKADQALKNIISWTRGQFIETKKKNAIIGISGGKDSTIAAAICCKAIGNNNVLGYYLPDGLTNDRDYVYKIGSILNIKIEEFNIRPITLAYEQLFGEEVCDTGYINRTRMMSLYHFADIHDGLVINTSNRSEMAVGNFIKWGDSVGDISPIRDFTVTELQILGNLLGLPEWLYMKEPAGDIRIINSEREEGNLILDKDRIGINYDVIDGVIRGTLQRRLTAEEIHILEDGSSRARDQFPMIRGPQLDESLFYEIN